MKKEFTKTRVKTLKDIAERHESREIKGCHSWRHFAVHQDRAWLLSALRKINNQVESIRRASTQDKSRLETEIQALLNMFEKETLNHLGD